MRPEAEVRAELERLQETVPKPGHRCGLGCDHDDYYEAYARDRIRVLEWVLDDVAKWFDVQQ